jgi:cation diffusion facilitator family transporter
MHRESIAAWQHDHTFGQQVQRAGETRTWWVIALTGVTMVVEVAAGVAFGSMALLADGLHMASHAGALAITAAGYAYARRHAADPRFSFGTGKVNSLAGFAGALLLAVFAAIMAWESLGRLLAPVAIAFNEAIAVAFLGLLVNGVSVALLGVEHDDHHDHGVHEHGHHDHNLRSAYLHVLADALTSVLAIVALVSGKYFGFGWMDPAMGIVGAVLITRWSLGLVRDTSRVLLDRQAPEDVRQRVKEAMEVEPGDRVSDLHVWSVGPGIYAAVVTVVTDDPQSTCLYKERLPSDLGIVHASIEVQHCQAHAHAI